MLLSEERMAHFFDVFQSGPIEAAFETDEEFFSIHMERNPEFGVSGKTTVKQWRVLGTPEEILEDVRLEQTSANIKYLMDRFSIEVDPDENLIGVCSTDTFDLGTWILLSDRLHLLEQRIEVEKDLVQNAIEAWATGVMMDDLRFQMKMEPEEN